MVETSSSMHYNAVNKRYEARPEHKVGSNRKKNGTNRRNSYDGASTRTGTMADGNNERESTMSSIDPDYRSHVLYMLKEDERNDQRRNETVKKRTRVENLERGFVGTSHDDVLPVWENCGINDQGNRERETVVNVDVNGYGSDADADPELLNVLACLKEYGNAYALEDGDSGLIIYEGECSSDDVSDRNSPRELRTNHEQHMNVNSVDENPRVDLVTESVNKGQKGVLRKRKISGLACTETVDGDAVWKNSTEVLNRNSPREMRMNHEQHMNVNSADENPRVDMVVESVNKGQKGVLRKRKIDGPACTGTVDGVAVQKKSTEVLNQKRIELTSRKSCVEKKQRNFLKEKNVAQREIEDSSGDSYEDSDDDDYDGDDSEDDYDGDDSEDDYDGDDSEDDYDDAYDYNDDCDDDYNCHQDVDKEYPLEKNLGKKLKGKNVVREDDRVKKKDVVQQSKKYLNRSSPIHLVMEDEKPSLGKSYKIPSLGKSNRKDKGKKVVSDVNEAKAKKNKWFKQDNRGSIGPSRPYKEKVVQSGSLLQKNVKGKNVVSDVNEAKTKKNKWFKQDNTGSIGPSRPYKEKVVQSGSLLKKNVKGKNVVSDVNEAKAKKNKWFKQDNNGSIGPSRPYKENVVQSGNQLKKNVKQEKMLKIAVVKRESDTDYDEVEILDSSEVIKEGGCFVPSKNTDQDGAGGPNGCDYYRQRLLQILNEPYDTKEYHKRSEDVEVYLKTYPDLQRKLAKYRYWKGRRLPILRGFFYWLQNSPHDGAFKPWKDAECLSVKLKAPKGRL